MSKASFKLTRERGNGQKFNGQDECTVTVDRKTNIVTVRPKHLREIYQMRLDDLANIIINRCVMADLKR